MTNVTMNIVLRLSFRIYYYCLTTRNVYTSMTYIESKKRKLCGYIIECHYGKQEREKDVYVVQFRK